MTHADEARDLLQPLQALAGRDAAFDPPTVLALIARIEQAEHRVRRYKALAETRLETIQRVRDYHQTQPAEEDMDPRCRCGQYAPCLTIQALEGDQK